MLHPGQNRNGTPQAEIVDRRSSGWVTVARNNDDKLVLAEYNDGPINAGYLRAGSDRAASETKDYVTKVTLVSEKLRVEFREGIELGVDSVHRDVSRRGKRLDEPAADSAGATRSDGQ